MRVLQVALYRAYNRVSASENAPCGSCHILELFHGLAEIVKGGADITVRIRIISLDDMKRPCKCGETYTLEV